MKQLFVICSFDRFVVATGVSERKKCSTPPAPTHSQSTSIGVLCVHVSVAFYRRTKPPTHSSMEVKIIWVISFIVQIKYRCLITALLYFFLCAHSCFHCAPRRTVDHIDTDCFKTIYECIRASIL